MRLLYKKSLRIVFFYFLDLFRLNFIFIHFLFY